MSGAFSENTLVEQPANELFAGLRWQTIGAFDEVFGSGGTLGRESAGEEKTKEVFGDYVSVYDFKQSVDDGATVPLFYENRIPELQLTQQHQELQRGRAQLSAERPEGEG